MMNETGYYFDSPKEKACGLIIRNICRSIAEEAEKSGNVPEDYASTLCFACVDKLGDRVMTFTLGDSHVYSVNSGIASLDEGTRSYDGGGVCATVTEFAQKHAVMNVRPMEKGEGFILATDGAWREWFTDGEMKVNIASMESSLENETLSDDSTFLYFS